MDAQTSYTLVEIVFREETQLYQYSKIAFEEYGCQGVEEYDISSQKISTTPYILWNHQSLEELEQKFKEEKIVGKFFFYDRYQAAAFVQKIEKEGISTYQSTHIQDDQKWNEEWKKHLKKISIGEFTIFPHGEREDVTTPYALSIIPGTGFGTGHHESTQLVLQLLTNPLILPQEIKVLDYGCGSGILSLAARKKYPQVQIDNYDIDLAALENCHQNYQVNDELTKVRFIHTSHQDKLRKHYSLVFCNILYPIIEKNIIHILSKLEKGGYIFFAGIIKEQQESLQKLIEKYRPCKLMDVKNLGDWVGLLFRGI